MTVLLCGITNAQKSHRSWTTDNGLPQNTVQDILQTHDGFLWVATERGLARFDGFDFVVYSHEQHPELTNDDALALAEDSSGAVLMKTTEGIFRLSSGKISAVQTFPERPSKREQEIRGFTWTYDGDEVKRLGPDGSVSEWKTASVVNSNRVQALLVDSHGVAWVGTRRGLFEIDEDKLKPVGDLDNDSILCLFQDREGNLWIGGSATGLHLLSPRSIDIVSAFGRRGITTVATAEAGEVWVGTPEDGLFQSRQGKVFSLTTDQGLSSNVVLALAASSGNGLLAGSPDGLNRVINGHVTSILRSEDGLPDDFVRSILSVSDGSIWIGTRRGLAHFAKGQISIIDHTKGLPSDLVGSLLYTSRGDLWIGTLYGPARLRGEELSSFEPKDGVTSLIEDGYGRVWMGTATSGLYLWSDTGFHKVLSPAVPQKIFGLLDDAHGYLWIRTHSGLARVAFDQAAMCAIRNVGDLSVRIFDSGDGLPSNDIFDIGHPGQTRDQNGVLYFATRRGLAKINPATLQSNPAFPLPTVMQISVDNRVRPIQSDHSVILEPSDRRTTFTYIAPSFRQPGKVHYRYRLEGFDHDWVDAGTSRSVSYTNLQPGKYRFVVMASNEDGVWSKVPAEIAVTVKPPIYRKWWFYLLAILVGAGIFLLFYWLRERKLKQQFAAVLSERSRIAREIHDTLAQDLAGVSVRLELVSSLMKKHQDEAATLQLEDTKAIVRDGLANARRSIWDLRATDEGEILPIRAKKAAEQIAGRSEDVHFKITGAYRPLPARTEDEILSILKEAVRNAVNHSGGAMVDVSLDYEVNVLTLKIRDHGRGFDVPTASVPGHYGLQGMRERAASIGATMTVESAPGDGTCVTLVAVSKG